MWEEIMDMPGEIFDITGEETEDERYTKLQQMWHEEEYNGYEWG